MPTIRPELILALLGAFLLAYGITLASRARSGRSGKGGKAACPECRRPMPADADSCPACGHARRHARRSPRAWALAGIGIACFGLCCAIGAVAVYDWLRQESRFGWSDESESAFTLGPFLGLGAGLSVFGLCVVVIGFRGQRAKGRRRCQRCWYLIDPALGMKCSECGHEAKRERDLSRPRRQWRLAALGLVLVALGQLGWLESRVRRGGPIAAVPTEVLILGMPWVPEDWLWENSTWGMEPEEDWTLSGRLGDWGGHAWGWHADLARWRADGLIRASSTPRTIERAMNILDGSEYWGERSPIWREGDDDFNRERVLALVSSAIRHLDDPDPTQRSAARDLYGATSWSGVALEEADLASLVVPGLDGLLAVARDGSHENSSVAILLLATAGRLEVVDLLVDRIGAGSADAAGALLLLAQTHASIRPRIVDMLDHPEAREREILTFLLFFNTTAPPEYLPPINRMLESDDPETVLHGVRASRAYPQEHERVVGLALDLAERDPARARPLLSALRHFAGQRERVVDRCLTLSRSEHLEHRAAAFDRLLGVLTETRQREVTERDHEIAAALRAMRRAESDASLQAEMDSMITLMYDHNLIRLLREPEP